MLTNPKQLSLVKTSIPDPNDPNRYQELHLSNQNGLSNGLNYMKSIWRKFFEGLEGIGRNEKTNSSIESEKIDTNPNEFIKKSV
jgi:hypothetical protein